MDNRTPVFVFSYPRSGSTWLCQMLADYLNCKFGGLGTKRPLGAEGAERSGNHIVYQTHNLMPCDERSVLITRDPRDISVSANHYWQIKDLSLTIKKMTEGLWPLTHGNGWPNFMDQANEMDFGYVIDYASLLANTEMYMVDMISALGLPLQDMEFLWEMLDRQSFSSRKEKVKKFGDKMPYGKAVQNRHLRKGISGDWRNHYTRELAEQAAEAWNSHLLAWGYEQYEDWWMEVS